MKRLIGVTSVSAILFFALFGAGGAVADEASTPVVSTPGVLAQFDVDSLPTPHTELWMLRITLGQEGQLPLDVQIGPTVIVVESGELTLSTNRPVRISHGSIEDPQPGSDVEGETNLTSGDAALITDGTSLAVSNQSGESVTFLGFLTFSGVRETESAATSSTAQEPVNATMTLLAAGAAEVAEGPGTLIVERVEVPEGDSMPFDTADGAELGSIEAGRATVTLSSGVMFWWPGAAMFDPASPPADEGQVGDNRFGAGESVDLITADGYSFGEGTSGTVVVVDDGPLTVLRLRVVPSPELATPTP